MTSPGIVVAGEAPRLTPEQFGRLRDLLAGFGGVFLDPAQQRVLEVGLAQRLAAVGDDLAAYERRLAEPAGRDELRRLAELVLNHETFFFRNAPQLRALREVLLLEMHRAKPPAEPLRIWSAGCSTGEEAYSLAITVLETLGRPLPRPVEIWATDLSALAIERARLGLYRGRALNNVTVQLLDRYFTPQGSGFLIGDAARALVRFEQLNLLDPFPPAARGVDAIFCQNVTIYFQAETRRQLIARFYDCLRDDGLLFLGFSETLWNVFDGFRSREVAGAYIYGKRPQPAARPQPASPRAPGPRRAAGPRTPTDAGPRLSGPIVARPPATGAPSADDREIVRRARALLDSGHAPQALELLRGVSPTSPLVPQVLVMVARAHADRGDLDLAIAEARRAIEIDALHEDAYALLGMIYARQGQWDAAIRELERARYLNPSAALVSYHLASAYQHAGRPDLAAREYRSARRKLEAHADDELLDGVAAGWLCASCDRQLELLT